MSEQANWITIEQAAVMLGLSVRTVNRHIAAGKLQSRLQDGRREVLIEDTPAVGNIEQSAGAVNAVTADPSVDYETVLALADNAADKAELAVSAYQALARTADERINHTRRLSYVAWSLVGVMVVISMGAIGWTTSKLTRTAVETEHLKRQVNFQTLQADAAVGECNDLRRALIEARAEAARSEGQLTAYNDSANRQTNPTTRPTLIERIASVFEP